MKGCALAARAARGLSDGAGIPATTLTRLLGDLRSRREVLDDRTVVVVDEAAMVGTRDLARLLDHAIAARTKVVLVGDHRQLPEVEAGGAFSALAHRLHRATLTDNRRQTDPFEQALLAEPRHGDPAVAVDALDRLGRIERFEDQNHAKARLVAEWLRARRGGGQVLMVALHRSDVEDLNRLARRHLVERGELAGPELCVEGLSPSPSAIGSPPCGIATTSGSSTVTPAGSPPSTSSAAS